MKIYLLNEHWYEGHDTIACFKNKEDVFSLLIQIIMTQSRINISDKEIFRKLYHAGWEIEEQELE